MADMFLDITYEDDIRLNIEKENGKKCCILKIKFEILKRKRMRNSKGKVKKKPGVEFTSYLFWNVMLICRDT